MILESIEHSYIPARKARELANFNVSDYADLSRLGIVMDDHAVNKLMSAMDAIEPSVTTGSMTTPIQFLQNWLPGFVRIVTARRKIDELVGIMVSGAWEDEEAVQGVMELLGTSVPYGDYTNVPLSSWNTNFERRSNVQFEEGMRVGSLEEARAARMRVDNASAKREAAALALEIARNRVGFSGYNAGANRTYGFLNDPGLPGYVTVPDGTSGFPEWSKKTYLEITADIRTAFSALRNQSGDIIDPEDTEITLALPTAVVDYLSVTSEFGNSVREWLTSTYPKTRVVSAPELNAANGGANVFYLYAETVNDQSTDGGRTFVQVVPAKFRLLGVAKLSKAYEEDYSNATCGVLCKRPYAVVRYSGI